MHLAHLLFLPTDTAFIPYGYSFSSISSTTAVEMPVRNIMIWLLLKQKKKQTLEDEKHEREIVLAWVVSTKKHTQESFRT